MASTPNIVTSIRQYCQGNAPVSQQELAKATLLALTTLSPAEKWAVIQKISREFTHETANTSYVTLLKQALCLPSHKESTKIPPWKETLLGTKLQVHLNVHHHFLKYSNSLNLALDSTLRTQCFQAGKISALIGSTFATNKPNHLNNQGHTILDALFAVTLPSPKKHKSKSSDTGVEEIVLALADGAGGHFGDSTQDTRIAQASYTAVKTCSRLFSAYQSPELLLKDLPSLITIIGKEIQQKALGEGATLTGCRTFREGTGFRVIGVNVGDGLLFGWHPESQIVYSLLPAHASEVGPAYLPTACRSFEIHTVDALLPNGTHLFLMSDGLHDHLPFQEEQKTYTNGLTYRARTLTDVKEDLGSIPLHSPPQAYPQVLVKRCFQRAEQERNGYHTPQTQPNIQMGEMTLPFCTMF